MAILFRKKKDESPFATALKNLIESDGGKLILSSGYFAYKTQLVDWIVDAASQSKLNEIVIIAGYMEPLEEETVDGKSKKKLMKTTTKILKKSMKN